MFYRLIINEAALWTGTLEYRWIKKKTAKKKKKSSNRKKQANNHKLNTVF